MFIARIGRAALFVCAVLCAQAAARADDVLAVELTAERAGDWRFEEGTWTFHDGELEQTDATRYNLAFLTGPSFADFQLSVDVNIRAAGDGGMGAPIIMFRAAGTRNFYRLHFDSETSALVILLARPSGSWEAVVRRSVEFTRDAWHTVRLECRGPKFTVHVDEKQVLEAEHGELAAGRIGLGTLEARVAFRNLRITGQPVADAGALAIEPQRIQVISRGEAAGPYQAFPDVCRLPNGELACVFYAGYGHVSFPNDAWPLGGRICLVRSADEGRTWSNPQVLFDGPQDDRDPHIAALSDGSVWCSFFRYQLVDGKPQFATCLVGSRDGGKTWDTEPRVITLPGWACSAPIRELPDGTRLLGVYMANDSTAHGGVLRSTDGGRTWSEPIAIDPDSGVRLDAETDVVRLTDGRLLAALRGDKKVNMHYATSSDAGQTWSKVRDLGFLGHCPHITRLSGGELLLGHRLPDTSLHVSRDDGQSWQGPYTLDAVGGAYPSTIELRDGTVLAVYYEEGRESAVRAVKFRLQSDGIEMLPWD
ncbi:MAG: exo-alpha-sialidase [Pirellulales bacterium]